jgi:hypothetical protein
LGASDFAQPPYTNSIWGQTYYELPVSQVAPNGQVTFNISSVAPKTVGSYDFSWRMFQFGKEWFGATCSKTVKVVDPNAVPLKNDAACISVNAPDYVKPGQAFTATVTMKNIGTKPWVAQNSSASWDIYHLGALDFQIPPYTTSKWGTTDYLLQDKSMVNPGEQTTFTLSPTAPTTEGTYDFSWQVYEHGIGWFGATCGKNIQITSKVPAPINPTAVCPSPGNSATVSWTAPTGYNTFYLRAKLWPNPADGSAIAWNDSYTNTSYTFNTTPGLSYNWWVHTKDPITNTPSDAIGTTFTCPNN